MDWVRFYYFLPKQRKRYKQLHFLTFFPWGQPTLEWGIIITVVITGLLNSSNTIATLKGAEHIFEEETTAKQYRASFFLTGSLSTMSGAIGVVPYAPYASSLGFLAVNGDS